jgi:hypothetical protein
MISNIALVVKGRKARNTKSTSSQASSRVSPFMKNPGCVHGVHFLGVLFVQCLQVRGWVVLRLRNKTDIEERFGLSFLYDGSVDIIGTPGS